MGLTIPPDTAQTRPAFVAAVFSRHEPATEFDYNDNGGIDVGDVVWLFNHL